MMALFGTSVCGMSGQEKTITVSEAEEPMQKGEFQPTWQSLETYTIPEWYRNAKFGIWAHWGPQCVEGSGDWMAREMYMEGNSRYKYHTEHYGHPSEFGFKDVLPLFKAENWNPDKLVAFYKKIGAQYFFALGNHHDNYDLWDSKYQEWNSQNIGPRKDILAGWAKAAKKNHLPFGISFHADHAWIWYETAQRHDKKGPKAGVPYDGKLTKADGKGKWWDGYDPQNLYVQNHTLSDGSWDDSSIHRQWGWENGASIPTKEYCTNFYNRTLDAINRYNPDLLYFDVTVLPLYPISDAGMKIAAHFYNHNMQQHKGKEKGVIFGKILNDEQRKALVWDVERGAPNKIIDIPWQTCTCIGGWHYNDHIYETDGYKKAPQIVKMLVDVVSKNGNLLLSVPLRADGTYDEKEEAILNEFGEWMKVNNECIYGTRPWRVFGEGTVADSDIPLNAQGFNEDFYNKVSSDEIRFTQTDKYVYAITLGWPASHNIVIKSMALDSKADSKKIKSIKLLGYGDVKFSQTANGLSVGLPSVNTNNIAPVLRIKYY